MIRPGVETVAAQRVVDLAGGWQQRPDPMGSRMDHGRTPPCDRSVCESPLMPARACLLHYAY
jgi:hypothetical protein